MCWLGVRAKSDVCTYFSVAVASNGGSGLGRDTHGIATKIYSECGNHDLETLAFYNATLTPSSTTWTIGLARRVAIGIGATISATGSGPSNSTNASTTISSFYRLTSSLEPSKSNAALIIATLADDFRLSTSDLASILPIFSARKASYEVVSTHIGPLATGVHFNQSSITTSNIFYDTIILDGVVPDAINSSVNASSNLLTL